MFLSIEIYGFDQIQKLVIPSQLVDWGVIANVSSLQGLEELHIVPQGNDGGDSFAHDLLELQNPPFTNGFFGLRTIVVDAENTSLWALNKISEVFPDVQIL
jgi:hypothetical protein